MKHVQAAAGAALALVLAGSAPAQTSLDIDGRAKSIAAASPVVELRSIATSRGGRDVHLLTLSAADNPDTMPALLIIAGLDGRHVIGVETALGVAERIAAEHRELLAGTTVYIVPCVNRDGLHHFMTAKPKTDSGRSIAPSDDDRDGRVDEDPPRDLNGDGVISMMRVKNPTATSGLRATLIIDPDEPRLMREPDAAKGESAEYAVLVEGTDADGDGRYAEDGYDDVDPGMNFPIRWPEFAAGAGRYPLSEPETRALAEWMLGRDNLVAVLVFGPGDNIINVPATGRYDPSGEVPLGIEAGDKPRHDRVAELFKEATGIKESPALGDAPGSLVAWAYGGMGLPTFSTPVWVRPDQMKEEEKPAAAAEDGQPEPDAGEDAAEPDETGTPRRRGGPDRREATPPAAPTPGAGLGFRVSQRGLGAIGLAAAFEAATTTAAVVQPEGAPRGGRRPGGFRGGGPPGGPGAAAGGRDGASGGAKSDDAKWLAYFDEKRGGEGFIAWTSFDHPQLGEVEIGGFVPGARLNPPEGESEALAGAQAAFVAKLAGLFPRLETEEPTVEPLGGGMYRVTVRVWNRGYFPTRGAAGIKVRRLPPVRASIDLPRERIIAGEPIQRSSSIDGGGSFDASWVVSAGAGEELVVELRDPNRPDMNIKAVTE